MILAVLVGAEPARAVLLWGDLGATQVHETGAGIDILGGVLRRDDTSTNTLYFKFHVDPLSDAATEEYFAAFQLFEGNHERLAVGNALKAWAYSAFATGQVGQSNQMVEYIDLNSARPESSGAGTFYTYELPHWGIERTIVFKVQYVRGGDDLVTVWLDPDLWPGATEASQPGMLTTRFTANASFDQIHLRHGGGGAGWIFSEMAIGTSFDDFVYGTGADGGGGRPDIGNGEAPFTFRSWQREQGLPENYVRALAQTRDGYLWVGSDDGVSRFDGVSFFSLGLPEGFQSGPVQVLFGDSHGALWIGSVDAGLSCWLDGKLRTYTECGGPLPLLRGDARSPVAFLPECPSAPLPRTFDSPAFQIRLKQSGGQGRHRFWDASRIRAPLVARCDFPDYASQTSGRKNFGAHPPGLAEFSSFANGASLCAQSGMRLRILPIFLLAALWWGASVHAGTLSVETAASGLIARVLPRQARPFVVEAIPSDGGRDVFEVESRGGKIILRGNNGVSVASALNWYLQNECHCDVSWNCGDQLNLPPQLPVLPALVRVVSPHQYRYAYNFCTHGYTMAWWNWPQWERELDFLALSGVNLALVIEGQESVWIQTLEKFGSANADVRAWLVMPSHQPWMYMDNMEGYGGPVSQTVVARRLELGRKIIARMRELGIEPCLPGYYGMVPPDFKAKFPKAKIHSQGDWVELRRPDILDPTDPLFPQVAAAFYAAQTNLFGGAHFYAADPFHEGGSTAGIDLGAAGRAIFQPMGGATWVLQSWQANPRPEMIASLDKNKLLVLDLFCEDHENWRLRHNFDGTPWLWCTIHNFGGNVDMGGRLAWMGAGPVTALNDPTKGRMSGIGALMEGGQVNPVLWELFFGNAWRSTAPDFEHWLDDYSRRRYGVKSPEAEQAWKILAKTIYDAPVAQGQYPANSVVCARPSLDPHQRAREWASTEPYYDTTQLVPAWKLLLAAAPAAQASDGYRYDLCDVGRQVLADLGTRYDQQIITAFTNGDTAALSQLSAKLLGLIRDLDTLAGTRREMLLGTWLADARSWGGTVADKDLCEQNARELLTVWTAGDNITDYSNRQWNGLLGDFYYHRWELWLQALNDSLVQKVVLDEPATRAQIRDWELAWTRTHNHFRTQPQGDVIAISRGLFEKYAPDAAKK